MTIELLLLALCPVRLLLAWGGSALGIAASALKVR